MDKLQYLLAGLYY